MAETDSTPVDTSTAPPPQDEESWVESQLDRPDGSVGDPEAHPLSERAIAAKAEKMGKSAPAAAADVPAEETPADEPVAPVLAEDAAAALAEARLRPIPGETTEQAWRRLARHNEGRARAHHGDWKTLKDELTAQRQMIQPLWQALQEQAMAQQREAAMRSIPDKEADPTGYQTWLLEENLRRTEEQRAQAQEAEQYTAQQEALVEQDEIALNDLAQGLEADEDVRAGYRFALQVGINATERQYPNSTPEQREELAKLSQQLMMRGLVRQGASVSDYFRNMYADARALLGAQNGHAQPQNGQAAQPAAPAAQPAQAPPQPRQQAPAPPQQPAQGSATAARLRTESATAAARAVVSPGPAATSPPSGEGIDLHALDEEQAFEVFQELARAGRAGDWDNMVKAQFGVARR